MKNEKKEKKNKIVLIIVLFIFILFISLILGLKKDKEEIPTINVPYEFSKQEEKKKCNLLEESKIEECLDKVSFVSAYYIERNLKDCLEISDLKTRNECIARLASIYKHSKNCERIADKKMSEVCVQDVGIGLRRVDFCDQYKDKGEPHEEQECIDRIYAFIYGDVGKINKCSDIQTLEYSGLCEMNSILDSGKSCDDIEDEKTRNECNSAEMIYKINKVEDCTLLKDKLYKRVCIDRFEKWADVDDITLHDGDGDGLWDSKELWVKTDPYNPDTDGDGLTDYEEVMIYRTNPVNSDTDGDGWSDKKEIQEKTSCQKPDTDGDGIIDSLDNNPMDNDQDRDGLIDEIELKFGTDINNSDTDGDGISDKDEFYRGLNPFGEGLIDSDKDGLLDIDEIFYKTDRFNPDTDGDGISDKDEIDNLTNPFGKGDMDFDEDGISDKDEKKYKTNPTKEDTDDDGMSDYDEVFIYKTNPNKFDERWK